MKPIIKYFNERVRQIIQNPGGCKFSREQFLDKFLTSSQNDDKAKTERIRQTLDLSQHFLDLVDNLRDDVFKQDGLPALRIKDLIRETKLELRSFTRSDDEFEAGHREEQKIQGKINEYQE